MRRAKWKRGDKITSLDELAEQRFIYEGDNPRPYHQGWFMVWRLSYARRQVKKGMLYKALPNEEYLRHKVKIRTCTCGANPSLWTGHKENSPFWELRCEDCGQASGKCDTEFHAVTTWNQKMWRFRHERRRGR